MSCKIEDIKKYISSIIESISITDDSTNIDNVRLDLYKSIAKNLDELYILENSEISDKNDDLKDIDNPPYYYIGFIMGNNIFSFTFESDFLITSSNMSHISSLFRKLMNKDYEFGIQRTFEIIENTDYSLKKSDFDFKENK
jgi:hypothetical protein